MAETYSLSLQRPKKKNMDIKRNNKKLSPDDKAGICEKFISILRAMGRDFDIPAL